MVDSGGGVSPPGGGEAKVPSAKALAHGLHAEDDQAKAEALIQLANNLDVTSEGPATRTLAEKLRKLGAVQSLCVLTGHEAPMIHQTALMLLATLSTVEVDANAAATVAIAKDSGSLPQVVDKLFSNVALTVAYACALIQNICSEPEVAQIVKAGGGVERLRELCLCDQPAIVQSATACLHNLLESMEAADKAIAVARAVSIMQAARRRRTAMAERRRLEAEKAERERQLEAERAERRRQLAIVRLGAGSHRACMRMRAYACIRSGPRGRLSRLTSCQHAPPWTSSCMRSLSAHTCLCTLSYPHAFNART